MKKAALLIDLKMSYAVGRPGIGEAMEVLCDQFPVTQWSIITLKWDLIRVPCAGVSKPFDTAF